MPDLNHGANWGFGLVMVGLVAIYAVCHVGMARWRQRRSAPHLRALHALESIYEDRRA